MSPGEIALENKKLELVKAMASQPTIKCTQGCEYTDPNRNLSKLFPKQTNGWDFANKVLDTATTVSPWLAVTKIASDGIKNAGNNTTNTDSNNESGGNTTSGDVDSSVTSGDVDNSSTTTTTDSNDNNSVTSGDVDNSTTDSNDNSSTTTTTDSNDNNSTVDSNDNNSVTNAAAESEGS